MNFCDDKALSYANRTPSEVWHISPCFTPTSKHFNFRNLLEPHYKPMRKLGIIISILETIKLRPRKVK